MCCKGQTTELYPFPGIHFTPWQSWACQHSLKLQFEGKLWRLFSRVRTTSSCIIFYGIIAINPSVTSSESSKCWEPQNVFNFWAVTLIFKKFSYKNQPQVEKRARERRDGESTWRTGTASHQNNWRCSQHVILELSEGYSLPSSFWSSQLFLSLPWWLQFSSLKFKASKRSS